MTNLEALQIVGDPKNAYSLKWCEALFQLRKMIENENKQKRISYWSNKRENNEKR